MKNWMLVGFIALGFTLIGCDKRDDNSGQQVVVQPPPAPPTTQCLNGQVNCNPNVYQPYGQYGFVPYGINPYSYGGYQTYWNNYGLNTFGGAYNGAHVGFCNCPAGYRPVYNSGMGLGCVALNSFQPVAYGAFYWGLQPQNYQWVNFNQVSNTTGYPTQNTCFDNVAGSCMLNNPSYACPAGLTCRPTAGGSVMGICAQ